MVSVAELRLLLSGKDEQSAVFKSVTKEADKFDKTIDEAAKSSSKFGSTLGDVGKIAAGFVIGQGLLKLPGLFMGFGTSASDFNETLSKSNTVFKDSAKEIEQWASGASRDFGQSKQQALDSASAFGNMFSQIGIGIPVAASMSKKMTELASDFASFHNADITEVLQAQQAAFRGEYDALQKFVPTINAAAVETEALAETGKKNAKQLTAQEKATATYNLMLKGAGEAMGDFDRTNSGAANSMRILAGIWADWKVKLGDLVLPAFTAVVLKLIEFTPLVDTLASKGAALAALGWDKISGPLGLIAGYTWDALTSGASALGNIAALTWDKIDGPLKALGGIAWEAIRDGAAGLASLAGLAWDKLGDPLKALGGIGWAALKDGADALAKLPGLAWDKLEAPLRALANIGWGALKDAAADAQDLTKKVEDLTPKVKELSDRNNDGKTSTNDLAAAWGALADKLQPAVEFLKPIANQLLKDAAEHGRILKEGVIGLGGAFKELGAALAPLAPVIEPLGKLLGIVLVGFIAGTLLALDGLVKFINLTLLVAFKALELGIKVVAGEIESFIKTIQLIWQVIDRPSEILYGIGKSIAQGLLNGLVDGAKAVWGEVSGWGDKIKSLKGPMSVDRTLLKPQGYAISVSLADGLVAGFKDVVVPAVSGMAASIKSLYDNVPDYVKRLSPAAGGDKTAAGTPGDYTTQYEGGGQYGYIRTNDKAIGEAGPNGTVWDGAQYVYPWEVGNYDSQGRKTGVGDPGSGSTTINFYDTKVVATNQAQAESSLTGVGFALRAMGAA
ncbi:MAG: hypothetical protein IT301_05245 [Dehalococcoidia bacterium]|nr:hypothetical protein [Dehalococcoidia bacterium]